ncbi:MAG: hypothetical protein AAF495_07350 [Pseudomonadota bacterium]
MQSIRTQSPVKAWARAGAIALLAGGLACLAPGAGQARPEAHFYHPHHGHESNHVAGNHHHHHHHDGHHKHHHHHWSDHWHDDYESPFHYHHWDGFYGLHTHSCRYERRAGKFSPFCQNHRGHWDRYRF